MKIRDDAIYCEHPGGVELAYIPYWRHEWLAWRDRRTIRRLTWAVAITSATAITALVVLLTR